MQDQDDYYMEDGERVLTASFHIKRGHCCGNECKHCPYVPNYEKGANLINIGNTDNEVYDEQRGYYAKTLPYGSNLGAPSIHPINISPWKRDGIKRVNDQLHAQLDELKNQYNALMEQVYWNELVYNSNFNFEPIIGHVYHLYQGKKDTQLSIISPEEWGKSLKLKWVGSFKLTSSKNWEVIKVAC